MLKTMATWIDAHVAIYRWSGFPITFLVELQVKAGLCDTILESLVEGRGLRR